jgi:hypothetical protein
MIRALPRQAGRRVQQNVAWHEVSLPNSCLPDQTTDEKKSLVVRDCAMLITSASIQVGQF